MQVRRWVRPETGEVRYYVDLRFGAAPFLTRDGNRLMHGRWIGEGDDGVAHVYAKTAHGTGRARTVDGDWLDRDMLGHDPVTFAQWEATFAACLTKSGNFSVAKFLKH